MAISINWATKVIYVSKADMTLIQTNPFEVRQLNLDTFRLALKNLEDGDEGMCFPDTHRHNTQVTIGGMTLSRVIEIINGYTVTFEDGQYAVSMVGANSNVGDVVNLNQVSVRSSNSAGLITVTSGSGLSSEEHDWLLRCLQSSEIKRCTVQDDAATTTKFNTDLTEAVNGFWDRAGVLLSSGQCQGQIRGVKTYKTANGELTLETPLSYPPQRGDDLVMIASRKYLAPDMDRVLGLVQENFRMKDQLYDDDNNLTSATVRIYATPADAQNDVNPIAEYLMSASFAGPGLCTGYVMRET